MNNLSSPRCRLSHIKMNGHTHYGKQNYRCLECGRQFVADSQHIGEDRQQLIKRLLLERLSLGRHLPRLRREPAVVMWLYQRTLRPTAG